MQKRLFVVYLTTLSVAWIILYYDYDVARDRRNEYVGREPTG